MKFNSAIDANKFVSFYFSALGYRAFVPGSFVYSYGDIRGITLSYSDEYIMDNIVSSVPLISVNGFHSKDPSKKDGKVPILSVKIGCKSFLIMLLWRFLCTILHFVSV